MKKYLVALMLLGFFAGNMNSIAQDYQKETKAELSESVDPVSFDKTTHNFGDVEKDVPATATFTVKNNRTEPLIITSVSTSCGCTAPEFTRGPIATGKTGTITLKYNSKAMGYFKKSAQVKTKDGKFFKLYIDGTVKTKEALAEK